MASARWVSLALGVGSALVVAALLSYAQLAGVIVTDSGFVEVPAIAVAVGLVVGLVHWLVAKRLALEVHRLAAHLEALGRSEGRTARYHAGMGLGELGDAAEGAIQGLRQRLTQLVSRRRELEVQVRIAEAERRHAEAILNAISDAVVVTDAFNEIVLANEAAARVLSFDLNGSLRRPADRVINDPTLIKLIKDTREAGNLSLRRHVEHRMGRNGQATTYDVTLSCVASSQGHSAAAEPAGVVTILHDITREKEIAEMKSDFVSNVSHELRTPLSSIKAYMEMLVDGEAQDDQTRLEFYNIIQGETNRLQRLIDNILNISRIESGVVKVQRENIALPALIKEAIDVMQPQARAKQIELVDVPTPLFFQVYADKDMIYQTTMNLISNAIKYTMNGGKVTVAISVDEHAKLVNVSVADTGVGIPPEDRPYLFEKFYRVADHKKLAKGTGLGLNLVKQIIETVHGGKVSVASDVGKGSTFTYSLPMAGNGY